MRLDLKKTIPPAFKTIGLLILVVIATVAVVNWYHDTFDPKPIKQDTAIDSTKIEVETTINDTVYAEVENGNSEDGDNTAALLDSTLSWCAFLATHERYEIRGEVFGKEVRSVKILRVTTRSTISARVEELAGGGYRVTAVGVDGAIIQEVGGELGKTTTAWEIGVPVKPKWYEFAWFRPEVSVWSMASRQGALVGVGLGWERQRLSIDLGTDGSNNYVGLRWKIIGK